MAVEPPEDAGTRTNSMEGGGYYNRFSSIQSAGAMTAQTLLEQAYAAVSTDGGDTPLIIADFGSSQGRNSLQPLRHFLVGLQRRLSVDRALVVVHTDLPSNDFTSLFDTVLNHPESYLSVAPNVFAYAAGRSFYEPLFPPNSLTFGWSSYALMWPSQLAALIPGHIYSTRAEPKILAQFDARGKEDWRRFLSLRAVELKLSGHLAVVLAARDDAGLHGLEPLMDIANDIFSEMIETGRITMIERQQMVLPAHPKSRQDLLEPFSAQEQFMGLQVVHCDVFEGPDPLWDQFLVDRDACAFAEGRAGFFRAAFGPTFASALDKTRSHDDRAAFLNALEEQLKKRLTDQPTAMKLVIGSMLIRKA